MSLTEIVQSWSSGKPRALASAGGYWAGWSARLMIQDRPLRWRKPSYAPWVCQKILSKRRLHHHVCEGRSAGFILLAPRRTRITASAPGRIQPNDCRPHHRFFPDPRGRKASPNFSWGAPRPPAENIRPHPAQIEPASYARHRPSRGLTPVWRKTTGSSRPQLRSLRHCGRLTGGGPPGRVQ